MLFAAGMICCTIAQARAEDSDLPLFNDARDEDGNRVTVVNFDQEELEKIQLAFKDATVNIIRGDKEKIELLNFIEGGYYNGVTNNTTLIIDNSTGLIKMLKEGFGGFSFGGFRYYLHNFRTLFNSKKIVNVYINENKELNSLSVSLESGVINIDNVKVDSDIVLSVGLGSIKINNIDNDFSVRITGNNCDVAIKNSSIRSLSLNLKKGDADISGLLLLSTLNAKISEEGDAKLSLDTITRFEDFSSSVTASEGINLYGTMVESPYTVKKGSSSAKSITITVSGGSVVVY